MSTPEYLARSIAAMRSIDPEIIAERPFDQYAPIGEGGNSTFYGLGAVSVCGQDQFVGLKVSNSRYHLSADVRFGIDLRIALHLTNRAPEFLAVLPRFTGLLAVEGDAEAVAIITEDASEDGLYEPKEQPFAAEGYAVLADRFADLGPVDAVFARDIIDNHVNHRVNGTDRWLDLNSSPFALLAFRKHLFPLQRGMNRVIDDAIPDLTVSIPASSPLAESLRISRGGASAARVRSVIKDSVSESR